MSLADVRFVKGLLVGILASLEDGPILGTALALGAIVYLIASMFTKEPQQ